MSATLEAPRAAATAAPLIKVRDLTVRFVSRDATVHAVNGVDLDLDHGQVLCILGESGSGKSVTLRALMKLLPRRAVVTGEIMVAGQDVQAMNERQLADFRGSSVAMIFQEPMTALDPVFTIGRQIAEAVQRHEGASRPRLLLADEPTTALDATVQIQVLLLLRRLQEQLGMGVVFVTHDLGVAGEIADQVAVMYAGRVVEQGPVGALMAGPLHPYAKGLLGATVHAGLRGKRLTTIPGAPPSLERLPTGCAFAPRCAEAEPACQAAPPAPRHLAGGRMACCLRVPEA